MPVVLDIELSCGKIFISLKCTDAFPGDFCLLCANVKTLPNPTILEDHS